MSDNENTPTLLPLPPLDAEELLHTMEHISEAYYIACKPLEVYSFQAICGFMHIFISNCKSAQSEGLDWRNGELPWRDKETRYLIEKLQQIFKVQLAPILSSEHLGTLKRLRERLAWTDNAADLAALDAVLGTLQ